ncbi:hypothetical protein [Aeromonas veronii]|uniref:hypothetical protein n=1 Tax=Aeromonas veronii TaxID=654 RepID=UPI003BA29B80
MTDSIKEQGALTLREQPPVFTSGFRFGISDEICIVELVDSPGDDVKKIVYSFAMTKKQAAGLANALGKFINGE